MATKVSQRLYSSRKMNLCESTHSHHYRRESSCRWSSPWTRPTQPPFGAQPADALALAGSPCCCRWRVCTSGRPCACSGTWRGAQRNCLHPCSTPHSLTSVNTKLHQLNIKSDFDKFFLQILRTDTISLTQKHINPIHLFPLSFLPFLIPVK